MNACMPLGYVGTIYNCNLWMLQDLELQRTVAKGVLKLHMHAITSSHKIIRKGDTWRTMAGVRCKLEATGETLRRAKVKINLS